MADINVNSIYQSGVSKDVQTGPGRPTSFQTNRSAAAPTGKAQGDTVTLSPAATATPAGGGSGPGLTDQEADSTAASLRQQLGVQSLSVTARQNQAILSLLR